MSKISELHLEPFSKALARRLLQAFPQWEAYIGREEREEDGLTVNVLRVEVPSANRSIVEPFEIVAELDRIVVAFWFAMKERSRWNTDWIYYHRTHRRSDPSPKPWQDDPLGMDRIVLWLQAFQNESIVAHYSRNGYGYSEPEGVQRYMKPGDKFVVRSWRGTYDGTFVAE